MMTIRTIVVMSSSPLSQRRHLRDVVATLVSQWLADGCSDWMSSRPRVDTCARSRADMCATTCERVRDHMRTCARSPADTCAITSGHVRDHERTRARPQQCRNNGNCCYSNDFVLHHCCDFVELRDVNSTENNREMAAGETAGGHSNRPALHDLCVVKCR